jgi:hypothetical protein
MELTPEDDAAYKLEWKVADFAKRWAELTGTPEDIYKGRVMLSRIGAKYKAKEIPQPEKLSLQQQVWALEAQIAVLQNRIEALTNQNKE